MKAFESVEARRGCGYRKPGGIYAVSPGGTLGGSVYVDCDLVMLQPPVPVDKKVLGLNPRSFVYVDGGGIVRRQDCSTWGLEPETADLRKTVWSTFGMSHELRVGMGVCEGCEDTWAVMEALKALEWEDKARFTPAVQRVADMIDELRPLWGDCGLTPAIATARWLRTERYKPPAWLLARCWQIAQAVEWVTDGYDIREAGLSRIVKAIGAEADILPLQRGHGLDSEARPADIILWVGTRYYDTVFHFAEEAQGRGASRRLPGIPTALCKAISRIFLVHPRAIVTSDGDLEELLATVFGDVVKDDPGLRPWLNTDMASALWSIQKKNKEVQALCKKHGVKFSPGVFAWYTATQLQGIVENADAEIPQEWKEAGITPVKVVPDETTANSVGT